MKTFKDLEFKPHKYIIGGTQAILDFNNGYGVSVITKSSYTRPGTPYELAVFKNGDICYDTPITNDVMGYLTAKEVTRIMKKIQRLNLNGLQILRKVMNNESKNE